MEPRPDRPRLAWWHRLVPSDWKKASQWQIALGLAVVVAAIALVSWYLGV